MLISRCSVVSEPGEGNRLRGRPGHSGLGGPLVPSPDHHRTFPSTLSMLMIQDLIYILTQLAQTYK